MAIVADVKIGTGPRIGVITVEWHKNDSCCCKLAIGVDCGGGTSAWAVTTVKPTDDNDKSSSKNNELAEIIVETIDAIFDMSRRALELNGGPWRITGE